MKMNLFKRKFKIHVSNSQMSKLLLNKSYLYVLPLLGLGGNQVDAKPIFLTTPFNNVSIKLLVQKSVRGLVTDESGKPLQGATVRVKGQNLTSITDSKGEFSFNSLNANSVLVITYRGFIPQDVNIGNNTIIQVKMLTEEQSLEELVVIGYGTQTKRDLTAAVSSVKTDDLVLSQGPEIGNMLKGKVPGVTIIQNSAQPGGGLDILVRGAGSVMASNQPLIVVDGFPISDLQQPSSGNRYDGGTQSILNSFNPNDIESIEVLKDASGTSIYGSRAANGVILITTKRGKEGQVKVDYTNNFSLQVYDRSFDVLPLNEWMEVRNEAGFEHWMWENGVYPYGTKTVDEAVTTAGHYIKPYTQNAINNVGRGTDWFELVTRNGSVSQHNISLLGGTKTTKYMISGNYYDQNGIVKNSDFSRYSVRANLDQEISKVFKFGLNFTASRIDNSNTQLGGEQYEKSGLIRAAIQMGPHIEAIDENGNYPVNPQLALQPNPYSLLTITDQGRIERMLLNSFLDINPIKDLTFRLKAGFDRGFTKRATYLPKTTLHGALENGRASISNLDKDDYLLEATANYTKVVGNGHKFDLLGGVSKQKFIERYSSSQATGFITDAFLWNNLGAGSMPLPSESYGPENMIASYFTRLNYNYNSRYMATVTVRTDGASVFAANNKWGTFPSAAVAWNIAEEPFFNNLRNSVSQLKLRVSYGQTGNATINSNAFAAYSAYPGWLSGNDTRMIAVSLSRLENPNLKWETTTGLNIGVDYSLFKGKIEGSLEVFNNVVSDLLDYKPLNSYHEVNSIIANIGKTRSKGIELSINTRNIKRDDFEWRTIFNISRYKDTWLERSPDWKPAVYQGVNDPIRSRYTRLSDGILQVGEDKPVAQPNLVPGQIKIKDIDGYVRDGSGNPAVDEMGRFLRTGAPDGIIDDADYILAGTTDPSCMIGFTNIINYKKFNLNFDFNGLLGRSIADPNFQAYGYSAFGIVAQGYNGLRSIKDRWTPTNPSETHPSSYWGFSSYGVGDFFMEDAWFIRLQNVSLGYDFSNKFFNKVFKSAKLNVSAHNLFVISPYGGIDPETDSYTAAYPNIRSFTAGLSLGF